MMGIATKVTGARDQLTQLRTAQQQTIERQKALRPQIREAKRRGADRDARILLNELRGLRGQLRRLHDEERALRARGGE